MYGQRRIVIQSAPDWASRYSQSDYLHFSSWRTRPPGAEVVPRDKLLEWDELNCNAINGDMVRLMKDPLFRNPPTWTRGAGPVKLSNLEKWARIGDPNERNWKHRFLPHRRVNEIARKELAFENVRMPNGAELFVEVLATSLKEHDVVFGALPAGYGKTVAARLVIEKLLNDEMNEIEALPMTIDRSALDLPTKLLTKSLHLTPSATNAVSAAAYTSKEKITDTSVTAYVHPLLDSGGWKDPYTDGIDHVFLPYREAEWLIDVGRFKAIVIDEVHLSDSAIISCLMRCLNAMTPVLDSDAAHCSNVPRRRVDKCLILTATNSTDLEGEIRKLVDAHSHLKYDYVRVPHLDSAWSMRRFPLTRSCFHAPGTREWTEIDHYYQTNLYRTPISEKLAIAMRDAHSKHFDYEYIEEDTKLDAPNGLFGCPSFVVNRIVTATEVLMKKFIEEGLEERDRRKEKRKAKCSMETEMRQKEGTPSFQLRNTREVVARIDKEPHKFPNIVVYTPSTGVAKQVINELRGPERKVNFFRPVDLLPDKIYPYAFVICSNTIAKEEPLIYSTEESFAEYVKERKPDEYDKPPAKARLCNEFYRGKVIVIVHGSEAGLTINDVGGIVDSGLERLSTPNARCGLSQNVFKLTDYELMEQRAGRGGRSRETEHIMCLGHYGMRCVSERASSVLEEKRHGELSIVDYFRREHDPRARDFHTFQYNHWNETTVEGRVSGVLTEPFGYVRTAQDVSEIERTGKSELDLEPSFDAKKAAQLFPNLHPSLSRMLIAYVNCKMALHGLIRVGLLATQINAMMKPSRGSTADSIVGPTPRMNTPDIFRLAIRSYTHGGLGTKCLPMPYRGDTPAMADFHAQLLMAAQWNIADDVPTQDEIVNKTNISHNNFFGGSWMPCGPFNREEELARRMDNHRSKERGGIHFTYTRLVIDEERKQLWSWMRNAAYDLVLTGYIDKPEDLLSEALNEHVHNLSSDPLLTLTGRSLLCVIDTIYSTRFATAISSGIYGKMRGEFYEFCMQYDGYDNRGRPIIVHKRLLRKIRAECSWNAGEETRWVRFDPAVASTKSNCLPNPDLVPVRYPWLDEGEQPPVLQPPYYYSNDDEDKEEEPLDEKYITACDSITDAQAALFANACGRWRVATEEGSTVLEVELNARNAYYGMSMKGESELINSIGAFRLWLRTNVPFSKYRKDPGNDYEKAIKKMVELWDLADNREQIIPYKDKDIEFLS